MFIEVTTNEGKFKINVLLLVKYKSYISSDFHINTVIHLSNGVGHYIHETVEELELKIEQAIGKSKSIWEE